MFVIHLHTYICRFYRKLSLFPNPSHPKSLPHLHLPYLPTYACRFDVTEAQFLHVALLVAAAIFGQKIYMLQVSHKSLWYHTSRGKRTRLYAQRGCVCVCVCRREGLVD